MSQWEKLLKRLKSIPNDMRFEELQKILEHYGYTNIGIAGSHYTFSKGNHDTISIPRHNPIKRPYVKLVKAVVEMEEENE